MPGIDHDTLELLKEAKSGKRVFFALVVKGGTDGKLLARKSKVSPTQIGQAKKECGGSRRNSRTLPRRRSRLGLRDREAHRAGSYHGHQVAPQRGELDGALRIPHQFRRGQPPHREAMASERPCRRLRSRAERHWGARRRPLPAPTDYAADAAAAGGSDIGHGRGPAAAAADGRPLDEREEDRNGRGRGQDGDMHFSRRAPPSRATIIQPASRCSTNSKR